MTGAEFIYLMIGAGTGTICGFLLGYIKLTDAEVRLIHHCRNETSERIDEHE